MTEAELTSGLVAALILSGSEYSPYPCTFYALTLTLYIVPALTEVV